MFKYVGNNDNLYRGDFDDTVLALIIKVGITLPLLEDNLQKEYLKTCCQIHETFNEDWASKIKQI